MTRCYYYLKNASKLRVEVVGTRGSDWGDIANSTHAPNETGFTVVQSMGCPRAGTETDHWGKCRGPIIHHCQADRCSLSSGWLYLKTYPIDMPNFVKYLAVFARLRHSGDCKEMGMDWTIINDNDKEPDYLPPRDMPSDGTYVATKTVPGIGSLKW